MKLSTLYKKAKTGKIQSWKVWTEGDEVVSLHGQIDGAQTEGRKKVKGKSAGRANETTAAEQAVLVAESTWRKKKDKGYFETEEEAKNETVFLPMLASDFEKRKKKIEYPVYVQPKFDGVRCLASWSGDSILLMSRGGKPYNVPHLSEQLESIMKPGEIFDGEIYTHGFTFQEVTRLVKKHREGESEQLDFWVYDIFSVDTLDEVFSERLKDLEELEHELPKKTNVHVTLTEIAPTEEHVYEYQRYFVKEGFEGAIVREPDGKYELGHRSQKLSKVKSFMDDEYVIIGFDKASGSQEGAVVWKCSTNKQQEFNVKPKGTLKENRELYKNGDKYIGAMLKVKFFELTDDGIPRFPVGIGIRLPEDM